VSHSPLRFSLATQYVRGLSSLTLLAGKLSRTDDAVNSLAVGQQHPAGEQLVAGVPRLDRQPVREVPEARVDITSAVAVEARRMENDAALEVPVHPIHGVPVLHQLPCTSWNVLPVPRPAPKPPGLYATGLVRRVRERAEGIGRDVDAVE